MKNIRLGVVFGILLLLGVPALAAEGALATEDEKFEKLQRVNEAQQRQLEVQQHQIEALMKELARLRTAVERLADSTNPQRATPDPGDAPVELPPAEVPTEDSSEPTLAESRAGEGATLSVSDTKESRPPPKSARVAQGDKYDTSPTSVDVSDFDPARLINIPGQETSIGLHGFAMLQIIHDTSGPDGNQFDTAFIPVDGAPSETKFNVNPSRIFITSLTPVSGGQLNTLLSIDMNDNVNTPEPRLRLAYGEYVNKGLALAVLAGQSIATMTDLQAVPEVVDFAVPAGTFAARQPLLRVTKAFGSSFMMEAAMETPQNVRYIDAEKRTRLPDAVLTADWRFNSDYFNHFRLGLLGRDLGAETATGATDSAFGWAVSTSTKVYLPFLGQGDNFRLNAHFGDGYGTQLKGGPTEAVFNTASSNLDVIGIWSVVGGIQHFWTNKVRSNLVLGHVSADNPASAPGDVLESTTYTSVNLIWNPYKTLTLGSEYLWGRREDFDGAAGDSNRFLLSSRFDF
jgi:hypothetical protein